MKYEDRIELEELSLKVYGTKSGYLSRMRKPANYQPDVFGTTKGKRAAGYATAEQMKEAMIKILEELQND